MKSITTNNLTTTSRTIQLIPIYAYPVLFWHGLDLLSDFRRIREMNRELNSNIIYLN